MEYMEHHTNYPKYTNNISAQFFYYLLLNMKQDMMNIIISGFRYYKPFIIDPSALMLRYTKGSLTFVLCLLLVFKEPTHSLICLSFIKPALQSYSSFYHNN